MTKWQPIETAPRDGSVIVVLWYDHELAEYAIVQWDELEDEGWLDTTFSDPLPATPTHWVGLPEEPK